MEHSILILDDEAPIRFALGRYFRSQGWSVDTAATVGEARELIRAGRYEAALVDLRLGTEGCGFEAVDCIRSRSPGTKLVMLSAYGSKEVEREAEKRGVDAFLNKPKPLARIAELLATLLDPPTSSGAPAAGPIGRREVES